MIVMPKAYLSQAQTKGIGGCSLLSLTNSLEGTRLITISPAKREFLRLLYFIYQLIGVQ